MKIHTTTVDHIIRLARDPANTGHDSPLFKFIQSLPRQEQIDLVALSLLGREGEGNFREWIHHVRRLGDDFIETIPSYLQKRHLAEYLSRGLEEYTPEKFPSIFLSHLKLMWARMLSYAGKFRIIRRKPIGHSGNDPARPKSPLNRFFIQGLFYLKIVPSEPTLITG